MSAGGRTPITGSEPARGLTMAALAAFLCLLYVRFEPAGAGLPLYLALGGVAVLGTVGAARQRASVAAGGAGVLALLGLPYATLWVFVLPMAGVLAATSLLIALDERTVERR